MVEAQHNAHDELQWPVDAKRESHVKRQPHIQVVIENLPRKVILSVQGDVQKVAHLGEQDLGRREDKVDKARSKQTVLIFAHGSRGINVVTAFSNELAKSGDN